MVKDLRPNHFICPKCEIPEDPHNEQWPVDCDCKEGVKVDIDRALSEIKKLCVDNNISLDELFVLGLDHVKDHNP